MNDRAAGLRMQLDGHGVALRRGFGERVNR